MAKLESSVYIILYLPTGEPLYVLKHFVGKYKNTIIPDGKLIGISAPRTLFKSGYTSPYLTVAKFRSKETAESHLMDVINRESCKKFNLRGYLFSIERVDKNFVLGAPE